MPPRQNTLKVHTAQDLNTLNSPNIIENRELRRLQVRPPLLTLGVTKTHTTIDPLAYFNVVGYDNIGANTFQAGTTGGTNNPVGLLVTLPTAGNITKITAYVSVTTGTASVGAKLYSGSAGARGSLLATSNTTTVTTTFQWLDFTFSTPYTASATTYWLEWEGTGGGGVGTPVGQIKYDTGGATNTGYDLLDNGTPQYETNRYSMYATYVPISSSFNQELLVSPFQLIKARAPGRIPVWEWTTIDAMMPNFTYLQAPTEAITNTDTLTRQTTRPLSESVTLTDVFNAFINHFATLTESITVTDTLLKAIVVVASEAITLSDTLLRTIQRTLSDAITVTDTFIGLIVAGFSIEMVQKLARPIKLLPGVIRTYTNIDAMMPNFTFSAVKAESITLTDSFLRTMLRTFTEAITNSDTFIGIINHFKTLTEAITVTDTLQRSIVYVLSEAISLTDSFIRATSRTLSEAITLTDILSAAKGAKSALLIEAITLTDTFSRSVTFVRVYLEAIVLTDTLQPRLNGVLIIWSHVQKSASATWTKAAKSASAVWSHISRN